MPQKGQKPEIWAILGSPEGRNLAYVTKNVIISEDSPNQYIH